MACVYSYNGKEYTRAELVGLIRSGALGTPLNETQARQWLKDKLGMSDHQVQVVKGLIEGRSYGRFLQDGSMLLSDVLEGVEYHEAFHRVWRAMLSVDERRAAQTEFLGRANAREVLQNKSKLYPGLTQNELIEEVLAEEFMFYQLNNGNYTVPPVTKNFFAKLLDLLRKLLGDSEFSIENLYKNIEAGKYRSLVTESYKGLGTANMVLWNKPIDPVTKQELVSAIAYDTLGFLVSNKYLDDLVSGQLDVTDVIKNSVYNLLFTGEKGGLYGLEEVDYELAEAVFEDVFDENDNIRSTSALIGELNKFMATLNINVKLDMEEAASDVANEQDIDGTDNEENSVGDNSFMKVSFEFDPVQGVTTKAKLLIASLPKTNLDGTTFKSRKLGLPQSMPFGKAANVIFDVLAGVPNNYEVVYNELDKAGVRHPFLYKLLQHLEAPGESTTDPYTQGLRSEFLSSFVKNKYTFVKALFNATDMKVINLGNESQAERFLQLWKNRLELSWNSDAELLEALRPIRNAADAALALGMQELVEQDLLLETVSDNVTVGNLILTLHGIIQDSLKKGTLRFNLYSKQDTKTIEIEGSVKKLAEIAASKGVPFDAMLLNGERKRIFAISQHSYQTIITGTLNWIAKTELEDGTFEENYANRLELLKQHVPHLLHVGNYYNGKISSFTLHKILSGVPVKIEVFDAVGAKRNTISTHKSGVTDQLALMVNNSYYGRMFSFKHGDRSVMFTYRFADRAQQINTLSLNQERVKELAVERTAMYVANELRIAATTTNTKNPHLGYGIINVHNKRGQLPSIDFIPQSVVNQLLTLVNEDDFVETVGATAASYIEKFVADQSTILYNGLVENRLFEQGPRATNPIGITAEFWDQALEDNNNDPVKAREAIALFASASAFLSYMEEMTLFTGASIHYKNPIDFFKRIQMQSSTGTAMQYGADVDQYIQALNDNDTFVLDDQEYTYGKNGVKKTGYISEVVLESEDYQSGYLDQMFESKIDGTQIPLPQYVTELGVLNELAATRPDLNEAQHKAIAKKRGLENAKALEKFDENDGSSWINIFYYREYQIRAKAWTPQLENTFQIELAVLQNKGSLADTVVYVDSSKTVISASQATENWTPVKIFDMVDIARQLDLKQGGLKWFRKYTDYFTMLKPQYNGPFLPDLNVTDTRLNLIAGRKEAHGVLIPSAIRGRTLDKLNNMMLRQGLDIVHMDSAAKYGRKMYGVFAPKEATQLYTPDGEFNPMIEQHLESTVSYLDPAYMKHQLDISSKPKDKIRNASQSTKLLLSDMFSNGVPVDITDARMREIFSEQDEDTKIAMSPLYAAYDNYKTALHGLVNKLIDELDAELGTEFTALKTALRNAAVQRGEPMYILDSIAQFSQQDGIELLPNWNRIENILYAMVTNSAVSIKRPGDGKPQFSVTMWEQTSRQRDTISGKLKSDQTVLAPYRFTFDETGNVESVQPAEVIMPISPKMISQLLQMAKTSNIITALEWYKNLPDERKFVIKSLRIPNQQFSFNDALCIKEFTPPTGQAYIVLPSEVVVKMGADFDIDKQQIYIPVMDREGRPLLVKSTAVERMRQYERFEKLSYDESPIEFGEELLNPVEAKKRVDTQIKTLEGQLDQLLVSEEFTNPNSNIYLEFADTIGQFRDLYGLSVPTIPEMYNVLRTRMMAAQISGENTSFYDEIIEQLDDLVDEIVFDQWDQISEALKDEIAGRKLQAFEARFPTPESQIHPNVWHNELLKAEIELLLHPANAHRIFASVDDSWLSKDLFHEIMSMVHGVTKAEVKANYDKYVLGEMNTLNFLSLYQNTKRSITMLESKANVGLVATNITGHSVWQVDGVKFKSSYGLPISDIAITPASLFSEDGRYISEILSTFLTSQVDGVKNPYAPALGLTKVTLPVVTMLTRFNVPARTILLITANKMVQEYQRAFAVNNSFVLSSGYGPLGVRVKPDTIYQRITKRQKPKIFTPIGVSVLEAAMTTPDPRVLDLFLELQKLANEFFVLQKDLTPDTKGLKSLAEVKDIEANQAEALESPIIESIRTYHKGLLQPFFRAREMYSSLFEGLYKLDHYLMESITKGFLSGRENADEKVRRYNKVVNDFLLFTLQNFIAPFNQTSVDQILSGDKSIAKLVQAKLDAEGESANYAISQLLPMLKIGEVDSKSIDNIRIQERGMNTLMMNDMYEAFSELPVNLQQGLMIASMFQSGLNTSRFTLREMINVEALQPVLTQLAQKANEVAVNEEYVNRFKQLFLFNNPDVLPEHARAAQYRKLTYIRTQDAKGRLVIQDIRSGITYQPRGSVYPAVLNYQMSDLKIPTAEADNTNWADVENNCPKLT